jgi:hypothetical protein
MIEQTPLVVAEWIYLDPGNITEGKDVLANTTSFEVMKKRKGDKKGLVCRFSSLFTVNSKISLNFIAEDSYVIDMADMIDKKELVTMISNSYSKFEAEFDKRKFTTAFISYRLSPFYVDKVDFDAIIPLLGPE